MAQVTVGYQERLEQIAWREYGSGAAVFVRAIIYANPSLALSDVTILPKDVVIEVPNPIPAHFAETAVIINAELKYLQALLDGTATMEAPGSRYTGYRTTDSMHTPD